MRISRILLFTASCTFLLLCLLVQLRMPLIEYALPMFLPKEVFSHTTLEMEHLDIEQATVASFSTHITTDNGTYQLSGKEIDLTFSLNEIRRGILQRLTINSLDITLPPAQDLADSRATGFRAEQFNRGVKLLQGVHLPFRHLEIRELSLRNAPFPIQKNKPVFLQITSSDTGRLHLKTLVPVTPTGALSFLGQRLENGSFKGEVIPIQSGRRLNSFIRARLSDGNLKVTSELDSGDIGHFFLTDKTLPIRGNLVATAVLNLENLPFFKADLTATNLKFANGSAEQTAVQIFGQFKGMQEIQLDPMSRARIKTISKGELEVAQLSIDLGGSYILKKGTLGVALTSATPLVAENLASGNLQLERLQLLHPVDIRQTGNILSLHISEDEPIQLDNLLLNTVTIEKLKLSPKGGIPLQINKDSSRFRVSGPAWQLSPAVMQRGKIRLQSSAIVLKDYEVTGPELNVRMKTEASSLAVNTDRFHLPLKDLSGSLTLTPLSFKSRLTFAPQYPAGLLDLAVRHRLDSRAGNLELSTRETIEFNENADSSSLVEGLKVPFSIHAGTLEFEAQTSWGKAKPVQAGAAVWLHDAGGTLKDYNFSGLTLHNKLQLLPQLISKKPGQIHLARLETPVPLTEIAAIPFVSVSPMGNKPKVTVDRLKAELFEGEVYADRISLDLNHREHQVTLKARNLNLPTILKPLNIKGLDVSGRINGRIPLFIGPDGVLVEEGEISGSEEGGTIRYKPPELTLSAKYTQYALKALEEFNYTQLQAPVSYHPDGTLLVDLHLKGRSPLLDTSRPVHLNIHTEQNLLSLLKSLQYSKVMVKKLDQQLQQ